MKVGYEGRKEEHSEATMTLGAGRVLHLEMLSGAHDETLQTMMMMQLPVLEKRINICTKWWIVTG